MKKPNKKFRIYVDPKDLNDAIIKEYYSIPTWNDLCSKLKNSNYFSVLDLKDGFWQNPLMNSQKLCSFGTMFGCYSFKRLPFGLNISAQVFQKYNENRFGDIEHAFIYLDDILMYTDSLEHHDIILEKY